MSLSPFRLHPLALTNMPRSLLAMILILLVLHQDNWFWTDGTLVFGFMPIGLFYHACLSVAAGATWFWAIKYCWPVGLEDGSTGEKSA